MCFRLLRQASVRGYNVGSIYNITEIRLRYKKLTRVQSLLRTSERSSLSVTNLVKVDT